jgi:hypothetical protein
LHVGVRRLVFNKERTKEPSGCIQLTGDENRLVSIADAAGLLALVWHETGAEGVNHLDNFVKPSLNKLRVAQCESTEVFSWIWYTHEFWKAQ